MRLRSAAAPGFCLLLQAVLGTTFTAGPGSAATIPVPPVTITKLDHRWWPNGNSRSTVTIPGPGYTSTGFTSAFAAGDVVSVRIQAPAGKKFVVHPPLDEANGFVLSVYWFGGPAGGESAHTVTFEGLLGPPPARETYSHVLPLTVWKEFEYSAGFEFTAIVVDITLAGPVDPAPRVISSVRSASAPSFGAFGQSPTYDPPMMELVDASIAVPALGTSWGRVKALYR